MSESDMTEKLGPRAEFKGDPGPQPNAGWLVLLLQGRVTCVECPIGAPVGNASYYMMRGMVAAGLCLSHAQTWQNRGAQIWTPKKDGPPTCWTPSPQEKEATKSILQKAHDLVYGDRAASYGSADENHTNIMNQFDCWINMRYGGSYPGDGLDAFDSLAFNVYQKMSRLAHSLGKDPNAPHMDSIVDGAGYFGVMGKIIEERAARAKK